MWRSRRWRKLLNLIDRLPRPSSYLEAVAEDEEYAAMVASEPEDDEAPKERWSDWSPEVSRLARIEDRLTELTHVLLQVNGGKPGRFRPSPRPVSALQRLRSEDRKVAHRTLVRRLLPPHDGGGGTSSSA